MVTSEEFACRVPGEAAIKIDTIYCSSQSTNHAEVLGDVATWCGVVITLIMAFFAYKAWKTSQTQLAITRDIALNEQRVPAITDLLESIDQRFGSNPDLVGEQTPDKSLKIVLRNHDRWTLTYPEIYKEGHLRKTLTNLNELTQMYHAYRDLNPRVQYDSQDDLDRFYRLKDEARLSLDEHLQQLNKLCLELHNAEISTGKTNTRFKQFSGQVEADLKKYNEAFPYWKIIGTQTGPTG